MYNFFALRSSVVNLSFIIGNLSASEYFLLHKAKKKDMEKQRRLRKNKRKTKKNKLIFFVAHLLSRTFFSLFSKIFKFLLLLSFLHLLLLLLILIFGLISLSQSGFSTVFPVFFTSFVLSKI